MSEQKSDEPQSSKPYLKRSQSFQVSCCTYHLRTGAAFIAAAQSQNAGTPDSTFLFHERKKGKAPRWLKPRSSNLRELRSPVSGWCAPGTIQGHSNLHLHVVGPVSTLENRGSSQPVASHVGRGGHPGPAGCPDLASNTPCVLPFSHSPQDSVYSWFPPRESTEDSTAPNLPVPTTASQPGDLWPGPSGQPRSLESEDAGACFPQYRISHS